MNSIFDGVPKKETEDYPKYNLLEQISMALTTVDSNTNS